MEKIIIELKENVSTKLALLLIEGQIKKSHEIFDIIEKIVAIQEDNKKENKPTENLIKGWIVPNNDKIAYLNYINDGIVQIRCAHCGKEYCNCCNIKCPYCKSKLILLFKSELKKT